MDIVYILGKGSRWKNNEIRYSMRSLKNLEHGKVFVIGEKCKWFSDEVIHIPADDTHDEKLRNAIHKLSIACKDKRISDDFILMNDDFFIMKKLDSVEYFHKGTLDESIANHQTKKGLYYETMIRTRNLLGGGLDYSMHYPFVYNKKNLKKILTEVSKKDKQFLLRTIYGNRNEVGGEQRNDVKINRPKDFNVYTQNKTDVMSTGDAIVMTDRFQKHIDHQFPLVCKYENNIV